MIVKNLLSALEGLSDLEQFKLDIHNEIDEYNKLKEKKGSSRPIYLWGYENLELKIVHCIKICELYLERKLNDKEIDYIISGLCLINFAYDFSFEKGEKLFDIIEKLADSEINGVLTEDKIKGIIKKLEILKLDE